MTDTQKKTKFAGDCPFCGNHFAYVWNHKKICPKNPGNEGKDVGAKKECPHCKKMWGNIVMHERGCPLNPANIAARNPDDDPDLDKPKRASSGNPYLDGIVEDDIEKAAQMNQGFDDDYPPITETVVEKIVGDDYKIMTEEDDEIEKLKAQIQAKEDEKRAKQIAQEREERIRQKEAEEKERLALIGVHADAPPSATKEKKQSIGFSIPHIDGYTNIERYAFYVDNGVITSKPLEFSGVVEQKGIDSIPSVLVIDNEGFIVPPKTIHGFLGIFPKDQEFEITDRGVILSDKKSRHIVPGKSVEANTYPIPEPESTVKQPTEALAQAIARIKVPAPIKEKEPQSSSAGNGWLYNLLKKKEKVKQ